MNLMEMFNRKKTIVNEGGNVAIGSHQAQQINLQVTNRSYIVPVLNDLLKGISDAYAQQYKEPLWDPKLLSSQKFLSGSSLHFFNVKGIPDQTFVEKKPKVGDIDTMVAKDKEGNLEQFLSAMTNKKIGNSTLLGFQRGNEQFSSLWQLDEPPIKIQIDLEFVAFTDKNEPTDWSRFSHSSDWNDIQSGVKGVFHKFLIQSFATLTNREFLLRKMVGRGKARTEQDVPTTDNMFSFAVSSKEGGGLRAKYTPVVNPATNEPEMKDGLPVMLALPTSGYEQDISKIFQMLFGVKLPEKAAEKLGDKFWSFTGLLDVMNKLLDPAEKTRVVDNFISKIYGKGAQGLYKNDPDRDIEEKTAALDLLLKTTKAKPSEDYTQMRDEYKAAYKMTEEMVDEADDVNAPVKPDYARQGIKHIYNRLPDGRVSSTEMKDAEFIDFCKEIADNGGTLNGVQVNLKVDGAGIRFGKDQNGRPFFMTSKVTEPLYRDNAGYFTNFSKEKGQGEEGQVRAQNYDNALEIITGSKFIQTLPDDTIVQAEMMYNPMAEQTPDGLKFVNIPYDPKKLGKEMTLVPFMVKQFSTGEDSPNADKIVKRLVSASDNNIKIMTNKLEQKGINVSSIIEPVLGLDPKNRKENREVLDQARQQLSDAIINSPSLKGKDALGSNMEGIVINMPSGRVVKVTSPKMKEAMAAKMSQKAAPAKGPSRTAVVAIGSFVGHIGHEQLWDYTVKKANELNGDPYLFIGNAVGKDDPIPPSVKVQTWHKMYPQYANNISTVTQEGGTLMQKIKHELINPRPGQPPKYDNIVIMVGEDQAKMNIANALMKAVNKFPGYENVKVSLEPTPRGTGMSFTKLRNILKDPRASEQEQYKLWAQGFDENKLGKDWILHLMDIARKGMGVAAPQAQPAAEPSPVAEMRLFNALIKPQLFEDQSVEEGLKPGWMLKQDPELAKKVKDKINLAKKRQASYGDKNAGKSVKDADVKEDQVNELDVKQTLNFIKKAHGTQQYGDKPYWTHPRSVAATGKKFFGNKFNSDAIKVAFLHDVVEDTNFSIDQLNKMGFNPEVVEAVFLLTKNKALSYSDNIKAIINSGNRLAMMVKYSDNYQNFTGDKSAMDPERRTRLQKKYAASLDMLGDALGIKQHLSKDHDEFRVTQEETQRLDPKCWKGYKKQGTKMKGGVRVNNCVPTKEEAGVGVIATKKQAKDPRYSMSLTKDVRPGQIEKGLKAFSLAEDVEDIKASLIEQIIRNNLGK